jgi:hypothetical protein
MQRNGAVAAITVNDDPVTAMHSNEEDVERIVPVEATDRSPEAIAIFPLPTDLSSVRQLPATHEG